LEVIFILGHDEEPVPRAVPLIAANGAIEIQALPSGHGGSQQGRRGWKEGRQMNQLDRALQVVRLAVPRVRVAVERTRGSTFADLSAGDHQVTLEWRPGEGFGISADTEQGYGEGPHEVIRDPAAAAARVILLLREGGSTRSPRDALLSELRQKEEITQEELARTLHVTQAAISRAERRFDMQVSTLRRMIAALGGRLELIAHFPGHSARIRQVGEEGEG
jgi:DNA-binding XRE family transcriptional regulator